MSALGGLLAGVAHELNNPLSVVVVHALMLEEEMVGAEKRRQVRKISEAAERCARIVKTFLAMARHDAAQFAPVDIGDVLRVAAEVSATAMMPTPFASTRRRPTRCPKPKGTPIN